jgi:hypothetical protein
MKRRRFMSSTENPQMQRSEVLAVVGEQEIELRRLRQQNADLTTQLNSLSARLFGALKRVPEESLVEGERDFLAAVEEHENAGEVAERA